jgi:uncharacterized protein (DUF697 family)
MTTHESVSTSETSARARQLDLGMLRTALKHLNSAAIKDGTWFPHLIAEHVKNHQAAISAATWDGMYPGLDAEARAEKHTVWVARKAAAAGALASVGASTGELLSLVTEGLAAPVGVPAAMLSMALEGAYTALLQVDLACDLGSIYGVPFDPDDAGEIATLFAVALDIEEKKQEKIAGAEATEAQGLEARLIALEEGQIATRIGRKLLEESVMKNVVPVVGVAISARWNYVATTVFGTKVNRYVRYRRAIRRAFARIDCSAVTDPMVLVEGAFYLATSDGGPTHEEVMAIALLAETLGRGERLDTSKARVEDEDEWLSRLAQLPANSHAAVIDTLSLVAATDRDLQVGERRILRRVGKALGREIDFTRIEQICRHLADGDDLPASGAEPPPHMGDASAPVMAAST